MPNAHACSSHCPRLHHLENILGSDDVCNQGDCVNLATDDGTYQVIGVDDQHDRCWMQALADRRPKSWLAGVRDLT